LKQLSGSKELSAVQSTFESNRHVAEGT